MKSNWKTISERPDYQVSNEGEVRSLKYGKIRILKPGKRAGYLFVNLSQNSEVDVRSVHQLVLEAFVGPCPAGKQAHHIDGDKSNNRLDNLKWVTPSENHECAYQDGLQVPPGERAVLQFTKDGQFVAEYKSLHEAERQTGIAWQNISACCRGERKSAGNFVWSYKDERGG